MNIFQDMMEKSAHLDQMMERVAAKDAKEEYKQRKKLAKSEYKARRKDVADEYSELRRGVGVAGAGGHLISRGIEAAKGGRKLGVGALTKALGTGGIAHAGATALTSPSKNRSIEDIKQETIRKAKMGQY